MKISPPLLRLAAALALSAACVQESPSPYPSPSQPAAGTAATATTTTPQPTVPPELLENGPSNPATEIYTYYNTLDSGDYDTAENSLLPVYRPGMDYTTAVRKAAALAGLAITRIADPETARQLAGMLTGLVP